MDGDPDQPLLEIDDAQDAGGGTSGGPSVKQDMARLADDVRQFLQAEMKYYQARLKYSTSLAKWTGFYFAVALVALFGTAIALILGLLLILSTHVGPVLATLIVCVAFAVIGMIAAILGRNSTRKFRFPEIESDDDG